MATQIGYWELAGISRRGVNKTASFRLTTRTWFIGTNGEIRTPNVYPAGPNLQLGATLPIVDHVGINGWRKYISNIYLRPPRYNDCGTCQFRTGLPGFSVQRITKIAKAPFGPPKPYLMAKKHGT